MNAIDLFSHKEKIDILQKIGYDIRVEDVKCSQPIYHNDMEYWEEKVDCVYKDGEPFKKPGGYGSMGTQWVHNVFYYEYNKRLKEHLTSILTQ